MHNRTPIAYIRNIVRRGRSFLRNHSWSNVESIGTQEMADKKQTFGVAKLSLAPKTTRQKIAVMAGLLLFGYWATDPNSSDSLSVTISPSESGDALGEIEVMLTELEGRHKSATPADDSPNSDSPDLAVAAMSTVPSESAMPAESTVSNAPPSLIIPSADPQPRSLVLHNASYTKSPDDAVVPLLSQPVSQTSTQQPHNVPTVPPTRPVAPAKIRLTGTITPL